MTEYCPTCGSVVEVVTSDEGTSSFRPPRSHLIIDEMVERAARALWAEGHPYLEWGLADKRAQRQTRADARVALEAALGAEGTRRAADARIGE